MVLKLQKNEKHWKEVVLQPLNGASFEIQINDSHAAMFYESENLIKISTSKQPDAHPP